MDELAAYWLPASLALGALTCGTFALLATRLPIFPGRTQFVVTQSALFWWIASDMIEHLQQRPESAEFWAEFAHLGIVLGPSCWGLFVWNYIYGRYRPSPRFLDWTLAAFALGIWGVALTNDAHHLIYRQVIMAAPPPHALFTYSHGPVYLAYHVVLFTIAIVAYCLILYSVLYADRLYRQHYIGFALGTTFPWIANALFLAGALSFPFDVTPLTFFLTNGIFYWLIRKRQMFDLLPIAHGMLLNVIPDPILVVDNHGRIAECNDSARQLDGGRILVGQSLSSLPTLEAALAGPEVVIGDRTFDVGGVPLDYAGSGVGRLILLHDVTRRKKAESELERQLQANIELQRKLKEESIRDPLTGLHNRRFLDELAPVLLGEADRSGQPLALVVIDIDHFKRLNDSYGHLAGDAVLRAMGAFLRHNSRQSDVVVRFGGEEFLVLMPQSHPDQAVARIDGWRADFSSRAVDYDGLPLTATFSAGIALYPEDSRDLTDLLHCADIALYQAKADGRNRALRWQGIR